MKVIVFIHTPADQHTAVYGYYLRLAAHALAAGHSLTVVAPQDFEGLARRHGRWLPVLYPFSAAAHLWKVAHEYDVAIFHSYAGWVANLIRPWVPRLRRLRTATAFHGLEPLYYRELRRHMALIGRPLRLPYRALHGGLVPRLLRASCRRSDVVLCLNRAEGEYIVAHRWTTRDRVRQLAHGIEPGFAAPRNFDRPARRLIFVGQWLEMKGIRYLADAFGRLAQRHPDLELICAGTLLDPETVHASFAGEARARVGVEPRVTRAELSAWYASGDIFVFPTLSEGFSQALLEAMASGLPVVATPAGAAADMLEHEVNALVIPVRNTDAIVAAVDRLLGDALLRARLGRAAAATAARFDRSAELSMVLAALNGLGSTAQGIGPAAPTIGRV